MTSGLRTLHQHYIFTTATTFHLFNVVSSMALQGIQALPIDFFHLLAAELSDRLDYTTLFNCIVSSKTLASSGAVNALYR